VRCYRQIINRLREVYLQAEIVIRADAVFAIPESYEFCESEGLSYVIGLITNDRLLASAGKLGEASQTAYAQSRLKQRVFAETDLQSPSLEDRRRTLESEKRTIQTEFDALNNQTRMPNRISEESIRGSLQGYLATLSANEDNRPELKLILGKMFPGKLSVRIREKNGFVEFDVLGKMLPFNLLQNASALMYKAGEGTRTPDLLITNQLLYQLSYTGLRYLLDLQDDRHPDRQD
jgi:hypothetical protein